MVWRKLSVPIRGALGLSGHAAGLAQLVEEAYLGQPNLADATRYLVHHLFGNEGLVIIDADSAKLKKEFLPVMSEDICTGKSYEVISASNEKLVERGFGVQVNGRPINFFI